MCGSSPRQRFDDRGLSGDRSGRPGWRNLIVSWSWTALASASSSRDTHGTWTPEREAEYVAEALHLLDVTRPVIVAHSWATLVALALTLRDPSAIAGLVLLSGYYYPTTRLDVALQTPASLPVIGAALRNTIIPLLSRINAPMAIKLMFAPMKVPARFKRLYSVPMASRPSQLKSFADDTVTMPSAAKRLSERYAEIQLPVRIIAGTEDRIVTTARQYEQLNRELHNSKLLLLEGTGHMTHHARPDLVSASVDELSDRPEGTQRVPAAAE